MKRIFACILTVIMLLSLVACGKKKDNNALKDIEKPKAAATADEVSAPKANKKAVEESPNVNGLRFTMTLHEFTAQYNKGIQQHKEFAVLQLGKWKQMEKEAEDDNGVQVQYWYYDDKNVTITATVEAKGGKLMNIGVGTTMSIFMGTTDNKNNSDLILAQAALVAQTACGFPEGSEPVLQDIFFRTTTEDKDLWYEGYVFCRTKETKGDSKNDAMQFRVFPVTNELKKEWKLEEYS